VIKWISKYHFKIEITEIALNYQYIYSVLTHELLDPFALSDVQRTISDE
jgi:hypothetical protein